MDEYGQIYNDIHTQAVKEAICTQPPNPVIQTQPLVVDPVEKNLPRSHQTALSQLRSGCCKALSSYQNRINPSINPACPDCGIGEPHTTVYVFLCLAKPTELDERDLWLRPLRVSHLFPHLLKNYLWRQAPPEDGPLTLAEWSKPKSMGYGSDKYSNQIPLRFLKVF